MPCLPILSRIEQHKGEKSVGLDHGSRTRPAGPGPRTGSGSVPPVPSSSSLSTPRQGQRTGGRVLGRLTTPGRRPSRESAARADSGEQRPPPIQPGAGRAPHRLGTPGSEQVALASAPHEIAERFVVSMMLPVNSFWPR